jgi:exodeoxyribonuclease-3
VSWNCRSGFHRKLEALHALAPDVAIIAECCSLETLGRKAPGLTPTRALWIGNNPNKGLGVFSFGARRLVRDDAYDPSISYALPVRVTGPDQSVFHLVALWAHHGLSGRTMSTVGPTLRALAAYEQFLRARPAIVAGDFNNHIRWDKTGKAWNHANTVAVFERLGFVSAYHVFQGLETVAANTSNDGRGNFSVRWIYVHMIEEDARHNGHADLLRERIDGAKGD